MKKTLVTLVVVGMIGGCSSTGDQELTESTKATEPVVTESTKTPIDDSPKENVEKYSQAFLSGDGKTAYDLLTEKCQDQFAKNDFIDLTKEAHDTYGDLPIKTYEETIDGNVAKVSYTYSNSEIDQTDEQWIKVGDNWLNDDC